jgi:prepilin-type processing-associated H-X9-DG protein
VQSGAIEPKLLITPQSGRSLPNNFDKLTPEQQATWINRSSDVVYVGAGKTVHDKPAETVLAYENWRHGNLQSVGVAFIDGHVEMKPRREAEALLKKQQGADK